MRVLLVEDNAAVADAVERGLAAEGFTVDVAADGVDGLWRCREFDYDVIILDIMLPGINGYELCRTVRAEGLVTPILMLTAKDGAYDIAEGLDLGADDYLVKPFSFVVLVARVRALARRANPVPTSDTITVGALVVDTAARTCRAADAPVELTAREYALLETLVRHVGQPLSRAQLVQHVWGSDIDVTSNVVDVYVGYLRRKLAPSGLDRSIETVRGVGYRMTPP